jgi:hypothetical protein
MGWLTSCDPEEEGAPDNLAMLGPDLVRFVEAEPIGTGKFRLGGIRRMHSAVPIRPDEHAIGEPFVLLKADTVAIASAALPGPGNRGPKTS